MRRTIEVLAIGLTLLSCSTFERATAAEASRPAGPIDVAQTTIGLLLGQVVDLEGRPQVGAAVTIQANGKTLGVAETDAKGYFAFSGVRGGLYQMNAREGVGLYRVWAPGTAPPAANQGALLVAGQDLVRGARPRMFGVVAGTLLATGVVVPIAAAVAQSEAEDEVHRRRPVSP